MTFQSRFFSRHLAPSPYIFLQIINENIRIIHKQLGTSDEGIDSRSRATVWVALPF